MARDQSPSRVRGKARRRAPRWATLAAASTLLAACSAASNYELLSFFFDGVPDPNYKPPIAAAPLLDPGQVSPPPQVIALFTHRPYAERRCTDCHLSSTASAGGRGFQMRDLRGLRLPAEELCVSCHAQPARKFEHAPALLGDCMRCHHPHSSPNEHLLLRPTARELCVTCHNEDTMASAGQHAGSGDQDCAACHDPHGGDVRYFLRPQRATTPSAGEPLLPPGIQKGGEPR